MSTERDNLEIHVDLCQLRYQQLDDRMTRVEQRIHEINLDLQSFKTEMREQFTEVKNLLMQNREEKFKVIVASVSGIIVALIGVVSYVITHLNR